MSFFSNIAHALDRDGRGAGLHVVGLLDGVVRSLDQRDGIVTGAVGEGDFGNQQLVLAQMRTLAESGTSVLMVTHDPNQALFCAHRVIVMEAGAVIAQGAPGDVVTTELLRRIYHGGVRVLDIPSDEGPARVCVPLT